MSGLHQQLAARALLHDPSFVHHQHPVGDPQHGGQVVGDEHHGHPPVHLELLEQLEHLGLLGGVEHRDGLVGHQELGLEHQRPGQRHPLQLAARQLVGVAGQEVVVGRQPGGPQGRPDPASCSSASPMPCSSRGSRTAWATVRRAERASNGSWNSSCTRRRAAFSSGPAGGQQVAAFELDRAFVGVEEPDEHRRQRRLARPAGADQADDLALEDLEADAVDGADPLLAAQRAADRIRLRQVAADQDRHDAAPDAGHQPIAVLAGRGDRAAAARRCSRRSPACSARRTGSPGRPRSGSAGHRGCRAGPSPRPAWAGR